MTRRRLQQLALCVSLALSGSAGFAADDKAAPAPPSASPAAQPSDVKRDFAAIMQDVQAEGQKLQKEIASPKDLGNKAKREAAAPNVIPSLKKMIGYFNELKDSGNPQGAMIAKQAIPQFSTFLALFGDKDTISELEKQAASSDKAEAVGAQSSLLMVHWVQSSEDAKAQEKLLGEADTLAKANAADEKLTNTLMEMGQLGAASPELSDKVQAIATSMDTPTAKQAKDQVAHEKKLKDMQNKPLTLEGVLVDGSKFSTADWKGKVIFVDFWATWCGPCRAELPRVKKAYADYHDKGLEVLGVSCDNDGDDLKKFLDENKDMPWPQLFDVKKPGWHPLATSYGIEGIPTMFLIDKKGVLRSVTARENFEEMIPKLLAE
ncbi:MAG TPA: TlpA disulfide reductase family protein [Tepidisphaeraceae bacterium]|nr:TlpA disulfide reductase family protein [Tepidisphaeraceae bacterium]